MNRVYEDDKTRSLAEEQDFIAIVTPKENHKHPWKYDRNY